MRFPLFLACASLLAIAIPEAGAAERCATSSASSVWVEGRWESCNGQYTWQPGYWQTTTTTVSTTPPQRWVEGQWMQGANGMVWVEGHYEQPQTVYASNEPICPSPATTVVYTQPPQTQVVYVQQRPCPETTVVVNGGYGYGYRPTYCAPRPVCAPAPVVCAPRPVCTTTVVQPVCPPARPSVSVGVCLPAPAIGFPTVSVGHHKLPIPIPVPIFGHR